VPGRTLDWDGIYNARDLGGLPTLDGGRTRWRALVRADHPNRLSERGWAELEAYGVRTVVDLRNDAEVEDDVVPRPVRTTTVRAAIDDVEDTEFWTFCHENDLDGSPLYYRRFLELKPERCAQALTAIARADPDGAVLFHCVGGRDRTGLVAVLLLALAGVTPEAIIGDYELSNQRLPRMWSQRGMEDQRPLIADALARRKTSAAALLEALLDSLEPEAYLLDAGVAAGDVAALRRRLIGHRRPAARGIAARRAP